MAQPVKPWCRVLVVEPGREIWGSQHYLLRLAGPMAERGVEHILAAPADGALARAWREAGHHTVHLRAPADRTIRDAHGRLAMGRLSREIGRTAAGAWRVARLARTIGVDAIHGNAHWSHLEVVAAGRIAGRPAVLHLHEQSRGDVLGRLRAIAVARSAVSIAVSRAVAQTLPAPAQAKVRVVPNGIDTDEFSPRDRTTRATPVVLMVARLEPAKGIEDVIRAVAGLSVNDVELLIAGTAVDPGYESRMRELGGQLLNSRVRFLGYRTDIPELLRGSDALVLASSFEAMGLSILEAQACGTVPVAYRTGGIPELVEHDRTGLLARAGDVADLTRQLERLLTEPGLTTRLGVAAREFAVTEMSRNAQADRYAAILAEVVRPR